MKLVPSRHGDSAGTCQCAFVCHQRHLGIWGSDAYLGCIDATEAGAMEQAMLAMAEASPLGVLGPRGISRGRPAG